MARYFAIAAVIVLGGFAIAGFWWAQQPRRELTIASVSTTMAPRSDPASSLDYAAGNRPFIATVPWALSVLPECFRQTLSARGNAAFVNARMPRNIEPIESPTILRYSDCRIVLDGASALVKRGDDRLRIPAPVRFYKGATGELIVLRQDAQLEELRIYVSR